jgi:hypothetical protein
LANGMTDEMKRKMAEGRARAKAMREQIDVAPAVEDGPTPDFQQITKYKSFTIEIEQPDRVMACKDTCVRAQWYGDIDECVKKAQEYIDECEGA